MTLVLFLPLPGERVGVRSSEHLTCFLRFHLTDFFDVCQLQGKGFVRHGGGIAPRVVFHHRFKKANHILIGSLGCSAYLFTSAAFLPSSILLNCWLHGMKNSSSSNMRVSPSIQHSRIAASKNSYRPSS
jgi:hypothetical protein